MTITKTRPAPLEAAPANWLTVCDNCGEVASGPNCCKAERELCGFCNGTGDDYEQEGATADCFDCGGTGTLGGGAS